MANPFEALKTETKVIKVKALGDAEVTIRELTYAESIEFSKRIFKGSKEDGTPAFDAQEYISLRVEKVAKCMVEPAMSVKELNALPSSAADAIAEISDAIDAFKEGNVKKK